jgi:hypothetical protein
MERISNASVNAVRPAREGALDCCPYCGCGFVQPKSWRELGDGRLRLKLQCPECRVCMVGSFDAELVERYDRSLVAGRRTLVDHYERLLRENIADEADLLARALELDLIGADDFAAI